MKYYAMAALFGGALGPSSDDWQVKIDEVVDEYHYKTPLLPRKLKKKRRIYLKSQYKFLNTMKNFNPF